MKETRIDSNIRKTESGITNYLFRFLLLEPPVESNMDASRVAGFLEARKAQIRRYFAQADMWKSISLEDSLTPTFLAMPLHLFVLAEASEDSLLSTLNVSFRDGPICGWRWENNFLFISSFGTMPKSSSGSQYIWYNDENAVNNSSTCRVTRQNGLNTTLY